MNSQELRKLQAPLKDRYREEPEAAVVTLRAKGNIGDEISCKVDTGRAMVEAGLHAASGGDGMLPCSGDLLLEALVACAGVTLKAVATAIGVELKSGTITAVGEIDFRGTLAVSKEVPVGFRDIRLVFELDTVASEDELKTLEKLTERYCVIFQTLNNGVSLSTSYHKSGKSL